MTYKEFYEACLENYRTYLGQFNTPEKAHKPELLTSINSAFSWSMERLISGTEIKEDSPQEILYPTDVDMNQIRYMDSRLDYIGDSEYEDLNESDIYLFIKVLFDDYMERKGIKFFVQTNREIVKDRLKRDGGK